MTFNLPELAAAAEQLAGFVIVMLVLCLLWGLTALMGRVLGRFAVAKAAVPVVVAEVPAPAEGPTEEELVVIAAAVAAVIDARHRVVAVRPVHSSWGQQGRRDIHASHRIR